MNFDLLMFAELTRLLLGQLAFFRGFFFLCLELPEHKLLSFWGCFHLARSRAILQHFERSALKTDFYIEA